MNARAETIERRLSEALSPTFLEIIDDSAAHAGHAGAVASGGGHFHATIVSEMFAGKPSVRRHQIVYQALGELMRSDIHALSMKLYTPDEFTHSQETHP